MFSRVSPACAAALLLCACSAKEPTREDVRIVRTTTVSLADEGSRSEYSGEARARHESTIGFRIAGRVAARLVEIGSRVKQGQPLARLEAGDAELNTGAARAQLEGLQTEYAQAKLDFERAQRVRIGERQQLTTANRRTLFERRQQVRRCDEHGARVRHRRSENPGVL